MYNRFLGVRLSKLAFSRSRVPWERYRTHTAILNEQWELAFTQNLPDCIRSEGFLDVGQLSAFVHKRLHWTYHVLKELKIIIMGNGYGALGTILLEPNK